MFTFHHPHVHNGEHLICCYSPKVCCTLPSTSSNESLTNIHAYTAYIPTHLYMQSFTVYIYMYISSVDHVLCISSIEKRENAKQSCCKVQLELEWLWMPCRSWKLLLLCCLFPSCSNRHPCPTWPNKQVPWGKSAGGSVLAAPPSRALSEPPKWRVNNSQQKKQLRHVEARPNKKEQDTQAHEHSNCLEHILDGIIGTYLLYVRRFYLCDVQKKCHAPTSNLCTPFWNPANSLSLCNSPLRIVWLLKNHNQSRTLAVRL